MTCGHNGSVLMVSNYPSDTAYAWWLMEHFWKTIAERNARSGCRTFLAYPKITSLSETIKSAPIEPIELSIPWQSRAQALQVQRFLKEKNVNSIYLTDQPYFNPQYLRMRLSGVKHIVIHDHTPGDRPPVNGLKGILKAFKNMAPGITADYVLCVSELMRQRNIANVRIPSHKCIVVQNGIRPVNCIDEQRTKIRNDLNVRPESILVITTGRAHPYKRFDFIIKVAETLRNMTNELDIVFLLVGDGPAMPKLREMVNNLKLDNTVHLLGFRKDVRDLLCASDLALHAALGEGFSLSIIEYMSAGLPVLVPDIPSVRQATIHNKTGIIYPNDDPEAVANSLLELATNSKQRLDMGEKSKSFANTKYNLDECTQRFINAIETGFSWI